MLSLESDRYGFPLDGLSAAEASSRAACVAREAKMAERKWGSDVSQQSFLQSLEGNKPLDKAAKLRVREAGIPDKLRPAVWLRLSGGLAKSQQYPAGIYAEFEEGASTNSLLSVLGSDLLRALGPRHPVLASSRTAAAVRRIAAGVFYLSQGAAGAHLSPNVLRLGAFLIAVLGLENEEAAFWILFALTEGPLADAQEDLHGRCLEQSVLEALAAKRCPKLTAALKVKDTNLSELTGSWFPTLFTAALPAETAVRVWDCLFMEGTKIFFRVALALLKMHEMQILAAGLQTGRALRWRVARVYCVEAMFKVAFHGIGRLSTACITRERETIEKQLSAALVDQHKRLQSVLTSTYPATWLPHRPVSTPRLGRTCSGSETASEASSSEIEYAI